MCSINCTIVPFSIATTHQVLKITAWHVCQFEYINLLQWRSNYKRSFRYSILVIFGSSWPKRLQNSSIYYESAVLQADVRSHWARLLIKGRLLQLRLPCEVNPQNATAQRSKITGNLVLSMPKACPGDSTLDVSLIKQNAGRSGSKQGAHVKTALILKMCFRIIQNK